MDDIKKAASEAGEKLEEGLDQATASLKSGLAAAADVASQAYDQGYQAWDQSLVSTVGSKRSRHVLHGGYQPRRCRIARPRGAAPMPLQAKLLPPPPPMLQSVFDKQLEWLKVKEQEALAVVSGEPCGVRSPPPPALLLKPSCTVRRMQPTACLLDTS